MSRLDYSLISEKLIDSCHSSKILPGIASDHSLVTLSFDINPNPCGRGYWKLNCSYLQRDSDFINLIQEVKMSFLLLQAIRWVLSHRHLKRCPETPVVRPFHMMVTRSTLRMELPHLKKEEMPRDSAFCEAILHEL